MQESIMELLRSSSHISGGNSAYVEDLYEQYILDPNSVAEDWRTYFEKLPRVEGVVSQDTPHSPIVEHFELLGKSKLRPAAAPVEGVSTEYERKQVRVVNLIAAYRNRGHQKANLDPLGLWQRQPPVDLDTHFHQLSAADLDTTFQTSNLYTGKSEATLKEIIETLEATYCGNVGVEFAHIDSAEEQQWLQNRMESVRSNPQYGDEVKRHVLERLSAAEGLEKYLGSRYPGTKRFGLEGAESLIPMLDELIQRSGSYGVQEVVIGMAHRGRLNVLINTLGKSPKELFDEFDGKAKYVGSADVKYHQGLSSNVMTSGGEVHLAMAFNPSHLEIVSPVVEGSVRARQDRRGDANQVLPVVAHGDAAFAGQGVVMETFQMSQTRGYKTGGTVHIVINNQVGFTTSNVEDSRSTEYCTDVAKVIQAPIFHVNGDDPEAVLFATQVALDFRQEFKKDVVLDLVCYRRRGHNEADEPSGTQPMMYEKIRNQTTTRDLYAETLVNEGVISAEQDKQLTDGYRDALDNGRHVAKSLVLEPNTGMFVDWNPYVGHDWTAFADTRVDASTIKDLAARLHTIPEGFPLQRQVSKIVEDRKKMAAGALPINWGFAETMAYATLLEEGHPVRLTGQDVGRGTFSHRHAVLHNQKETASYVPLQNLSENQPTFTIHDSLLSEEAVLAFEYGYSTTTPNALIIWEAQFGDFANGAQVVIDQFITSGEHKWQRLCGLTLLLPHGYEGQGPEHSSARLERFLQMSAEHNIQVCVPSTPAQVYHMLRRQIIRPLRKPLIVMSPKSLLRHKQAVSTMDELAEGSFKTVIGEVDEVDNNAVKRVVLCSGKVYYDLYNKRQEEGISDIAVVRIEQLYPFPSDDLQQELEKYPNLEELVWCQDEPQNQGAWYSSQHHMRRVLQAVKPVAELNYAGREASASPAAGYMALHLAQQEQLIKDALALG
ncbi:2-oxoglutarate dehydrogenase E1 component [Sinobacterium norvegicum]|uniref:oxoglutarate dehydrogenase (succinyl-transferring) n=1 Tax=Sinobacterium norvegicum TaxID=1641715 RepID=A0ABN8EE43_9GAMM|nr:2-oxoglutarate dehydrogenase E1 component [Sinobacterium norvegicum]CAH0990496.1 2-oxoglutarate dehydrogenase E1 component [Sinobacterium norvegicum]